MSLDSQRQLLLETIRSYGPVAVAFSGGVDSAVVARAAFEVWEEKAVAVTAESPSLAEGELGEAQRVAESIGIAHVTIRTDEFQHAEYQRNAGNRCYFCKNELYSQLHKHLADWNVNAICNGANLDDTSDYRPGMQAAEDHQVRSPLIDARFTKEHVRELARFWNLSVWDKPAMPCLSSRIAYGVEVTPERVSRVDLAEKFLKDLLQVVELRVRLEANDLARIEIPLESLPNVFEGGNQLLISHKLRELGFRYVTLDLEGFRSGSLNSALEVVELQRWNGSPPADTGSA